jgi:hypothetical protein
MIALDPEFAPNWGDSRARYDAWWEGRMLDRPPVYLTVRRETPRWPAAPPDPGGDFSRQLLDPSFIVARIEAELAVTRYVADAFPVWQRGLNTATLAAFCHARLEYANDTVWVHPHIEDWTQEPLPSFDPQNALHQRCVEVASAVAERCEGRWVAAIPDLADAGSTMLQLRGAEKLVMDLLEDAPGLTEYRQALTHTWRDAFAWWRVHDVAAGLEGHVGWWRLFSSARYGLVQSDVSALLSPRLFSSFVLPELAETSAWLGRSVFHLDGPGELPHLDALLELPHIIAIQWQPGDGQPTCGHWIGLLRKIQDAGRGLQLFAWPDDLPAVTSGLRPEGIMLWFPDAMSQAEADDVLRQIDRWAGCH